MSGVWTAEKIIALAPDAASAKAGKELATARKWVTFGADERSAWGECQGSGSKPYQVQIDLSEPAFKCSCPSRKFPCKHSLALFLMLAGSADAFAGKAPPAWVQEWLKGRAQRNEQKAKKAESAAPVDPEAQAKRAAEREKKVAAGLKEAELWLHDLVRQGLAAVQGRPMSFWESPAARMVDAQAPGVARIIREMAATVSSGEGWQDRLLEQLSRLHLLLEAYGRRDALSPELQADVRAIIGWTQSQDELFARAGVRDVWLALGQRTDLEDRLRVQRTWLVGKSSGTSALVLQFAHGTQPFEASLIAGTSFEAELVFYPSAWPMRAMIKARFGAAAGLEALPGAPSIAAAAGKYAEALAACPWIERVGWSLSSVTPYYVAGSWRLRDSEGREVPLPPRYSRGWQLAAASGGKPIAVFGEFDGRVLLPLSMRAEEGFTLLSPATESKASA